MAKLAGCFEGCLNSAGRGAFNSVQNARKAKTQFLYQNKTAFMLSLCADIWSLDNKAKRLGLIPLIRPNGTSDLCYENQQVIDGKPFSNCFRISNFMTTQKYPVETSKGKRAEIMTSLTHSLPLPQNRYRSRD